MSVQRIIQIQFGIIAMMFAINIGIILAVVHVQRVQNVNHQYTNSTLTNIQKEMICIGAFFDQPGAVRSQSSIATLKACQPVVAEAQ